MLRGRFAGTLAMATGGCARYAFCVDAGYCLDRRGYPLLNYSSPNPHHHLILTNTTMTLRLPHVVDAEGNEMSILIVTGMLTLVDPGDHDSIDRHARHFQSITENYSRGESRLYRLVPDGACFELFSGKRLSVDLPALVRRNLLSSREEDSLMAAIDRAPYAPVELVGIDEHGIDLRVGSDLRFRPFATAPVDRSALPEAIRSVLIPARVTS